MIKLIQKLIQFANRHPRVRDIILSYIAIDLAFALLEAAWDGLRARAAARMFPVRVGSREAESLYFISWMDENKKAMEGLPQSYIVETYLNHREAIQPNTREARLLESYESSFRRLFV